MVLTYTLVLYFINHNSAQIIANALYVSLYVFVLCEDG